MGGKCGHIDEVVKGVGPLSRISPHLWPAFMQLIVGLRRNDRLLSIESELLDGYNIHDKHTLRDWRHSYQGALRKAMLLGEGAAIGGPGEVVVFDETQMGVHKGINTRTDRHRMSRNSRPVRRARVAKTLPARTIWKQPAASGVLRRPAAANRPAASGVLRRPAAAKRPAAAGVLRRPAAVKRPAAAGGSRKGPRVNARWLWMAVTVGKGRECYTHENGKKKVTFAFLPRRENAPHGSPRGLVSMTKVIKQHVKKRSFLVFDGWKSSVAAVKRLGYRSAPPVDHCAGWRDRSTGFHSNDIESENARMKMWLRTRYSKMPVLNAAASDAVGAADPESAPCEEEQTMPLPDLAEYAHYVNSGKSMAAAMEALANANGGAYRPFRLR